MDCPFCPRRIDDDPLKEIDSSARNEGKKKNMKKGQSHVKAAANCEVGAIFKQLAPACSICGKGDATTAAAVREDGVPQEELKCRLCRSKRGAAAALWKTTSPSNTKIAMANSFRAIFWCFSKMLSRRLSTRLFLKPGGLRPRPLAGGVWSPPYSGRNFI